MFKLSYIVNGQRITKNNINFPFVHISEAIQRYKILNSVTITKLY